MKIDLTLSYDLSPSDVAVVRTTPWGSSPEYRGEPVARVWQVRQYLEEERDGETYVVLYENDSLRDTSDWCVERALVPVVFQASEVPFSRRQIERPSEFASRQLDQQTTAVDDTDREILS